MNIPELFEQIADRHRDAFDASFKGESIDVLEKISREILKAFKSGKKVMLCGNGGSASDSQHIAAEFVGRFKRERQSLPAIALTTDTSILTAVANDYSYEDIFSRQVEGLGAEGDILIGISTSGNSGNVIKAVKVAKEKNIVTIAMTGGSGGKLAGECDLAFVAGSKLTPHIQEVHIAALHAVSEVVEDVFFGS